MSESTELSCFTEQDFQAIEAAVLETEKGRWFLEQFSRRNRVADTQTLLNAIGRLERNISEQPAQQIDEACDIAALARAIDATSTDIKSVRNDMLCDHAEMAPGKDVYSQISQSAHQIAADLIATAESLQTNVSGLRETNAGSPQIKAIDNHVHTLFDGGWRQDVLAQRISKAMGLLEHLDQNLKALSGSTANTDWSAPAGQSAPVELSPDNLKYFNGDDELFSTEHEDPTDQQEPALELIAGEQANDSEDSEPESTQGNEAVSQGDEASSQTPDAAETTEPKVVIIRQGQPAASQDDNPKSADDDETAPQPSPASSEPDKQAATSESDQPPATSDAISAFEDIAAPLVEAPQPELTATTEEKQRIVIIRRTSSADSEIPFADYLGVDDTQEPTKPAN